MVHQHHSILLHYYLFTLHFPLLPPPGEVVPQDRSGSAPQSSALPRKNPSGSADPPPLRGEAKKDSQPKPPLCKGRCPAGAEGLSHRATNNPPVCCADRPLCTRGPLVPGFHPTSPYGHCEEGFIPDVAIRIPRPHSLLSIIYSLFSILSTADLLPKNKE